MHVVLEATGLRVFLRPGSGPDIELFPNPTGLGQLAGAAVEEALPFLLNALAAQTGNDLAGTAGEIVRVLGDIGDLRPGGQFTSERLHDWAADPAARLAARLPLVASGVLTDLVAALQPALPAGVTATMSAGELHVVAAGVTLAVHPAPFSVRVAGAVTGIPVVDRLELAVASDSTGLTELSAAVGPIAIDAGGIPLRPWATIAVGRAPPGGRRVGLGLALDEAGTRRLGLRWTPDDGHAVIEATENSVPIAGAAGVPAYSLDALIGLAAGLVLDHATVTALLATVVGSGTVGSILEGPVLHTAAGHHRLADGLLDPDLLGDRILELLGNLAEAGPSVTIEGLTVGLAGAGGSVGLHLGLTDRFTLPVGGDVTVALEFDSSWIIGPAGPPAPGLTVTMLTVPGGNATFAPGLELDGIGIRIGKTSGPLLDVGASLGSVAVHGYGRVGGGGPSAWGVQLQLSDLAIGVAGAQGGNPVAQGVMADAGKGPAKLAPRFSPALAVQQTTGGPVLVSLRAGDRPGPWWLAIQKGFGPIYIEQVGLGVTVQQDHLQKISLLLDGRVSLFGLTAAVDDLQLTFVVASDASPSIRRGGRSTSPAWPSPPTSAASPSPAACAGSARGRTSSTSAC